MTDVHPAELSEATGQWLLAHARHALACSLGAPSTEPGPSPDDPMLEAPARVFVSWHAASSGALVGCMGTLSPWPSLRDAVQRYAVAAGHDSRTPKLDPKAVGTLECEISVLGAPQLLEAAGFDAIAAALVPLRDGVELRDRHGRGAFFLPVVWKSLPEADAFLTALARKAGIDLALEREFLRAEVMRAVVIR